MATAISLASTWSMTHPTSSVSRSVRQPAVATAQGHSHAHAHTRSTTGARSPSQQAAAAGARSSRHASTAYASAYTAASRSSPPKTERRKPHDPYYGHERVSLLSERVVNLLFCCPSATADGATLRAGAAQKPAPPLSQFVAYALYRTRLPESVTYHALYLLKRLKQLFPAARGNSGHSLFISAFMIASKVLCDDTYSNKSWAIVGQGLFSLHEINHMERELLSFLNYHVNIHPAKLASFTTALNTDQVDLEQFLYLACVAPHHTQPPPPPPPQLQLHVPPSPTCTKSSAHSSPGPARTSPVPSSANQTGGLCAQEVFEPVRAHSVSSLDHAHYTSSHAIRATRLARAASTSAAAAPPPSHAAHTYTQPAVDAAPPPRSPGPSPTHHGWPYTYPLCRVETTSRRAGYAVPPCDGSVRPVSACTSAPTAWVPRSTSIGTSRVTVRGSRSGSFMSEVPRLTASCSSTVSSVSALSSVEMLSPVALSPNFVSSADAYTSGTVSSIAGKPAVPVDTALDAIEWAP